jgi:hypothetical protein
MKLLISCIFFCLLACTELPPEQKSINETLNMHLNTGMFNRLFHKGEWVQMNTFRKQFRFVSVVYLQNECSPCYSKYIEWINFANGVENYRNYSVLFIIKGLDVEDFIAQVDQIEKVNHNQFIIMDPNFYFNDGNTNIPRWILDLSILMDSNNRIRYIGSPYSSELSKNRFLKIIANGKK